MPNNKVEQQESQKKILKSSGIVGFAQIIMILVSVVRTKVLAVLLGPAGVGLSGMYQSINDLIRTATGLGLNYSAVKEIAQAGTAENNVIIAKTVKALRRAVFFTGLVGMLLTVSFSKQISIYSFGDESHAIYISILSITILTATISAGQIALLQGLRKMRDVALSNVTGAILGLLIAVPIYAIWGEAGIVPSLLCVALSTLLCSWFFARRIDLPDVSISFKYVATKGLIMAKLGVFMVLATFIEITTMYLARSIVIDKGGIALVGQYIAAWTISTLYVSAILNAIGSEYFQRVSAVNHDQAAVNKLINEQTELLLIMACPAIVIMISFISFAVNIFYSKQFHTTIEILNWQLAGDFFKVVQWPITFALLAKGKGHFYALINLFWGALYIGTLLVGWKMVGIEITGIALIIANFFSFTCIYLLFRSCFKINWSKKVVSLALIFSLLISAASLSVFCLEQLTQILAGVVLSFTAITISIKSLQNIWGDIAILKRLKILK